MIPNAHSEQYPLNHFDGCDSFFHAFPTEYPTINWLHFWYKHLRKVFSGSNGNIVCFQYQLVFKFLGEVDYAFRNLNEIFQDTMCLKSKPHHTLQDQLFFNSKLGSNKYCFTSEITNLYNLTKPDKANALQTHYCLVMI